MTLYLSMHFFGLLLYGLNVINDGNIPFPGFVSKDDMNKLSNFIDFIHPNLQIINNKLVNIGDPIKSGTIIMISYPLLIHTDFHQKQIKNILSQLKHMNTHLQTYQSVLNYLNNLTISSDTDTTQFMQKLQRNYYQRAKHFNEQYYQYESYIKKFIQYSTLIGDDTYGLYQYLHLLNDHNNTGESNVLSRIHFERFNLLFVGCPFVTHAVEDIQNGTILVHRIQHDIIDPTNAERISWQIKLLENDDNLSEKHKNDLLNGILRSPIHFELEKIKKIHVDSMVCPQLNAKLLHVLYSNEISVEYITHIATVAYQALVTYGHLCMRIHQQGQAFTYFHMAGLNGKLDHWHSIMIDFWSKADLRGCSNAFRYIPFNRIMSKYVYVIY